MAEFNEEAIYRWTPQEKWNYQQIIYDPEGISMPLRVLTFTKQQRQACSVSLRILPFSKDAGWEREAQMVASGALKMPEEVMDWERFFLAPAGSVSQEIAAVEVALGSRGDR